MPLIMCKVFSSHVSEVGYDAEAEQLHVKFTNGKHAVYESVPADVAARVTEAPSIGMALHQFVKGKYLHGYK